VNVDTAETPTLTPDAAAAALPAADTVDPAPPSRWRRRVRIGLRVAAVLAGLVVLYVGVTFVQVWRASRQDNAQHAQAIIVLGAAQYNGRPSPVLAARLDHAADLYHAGYADLVVVTGGRQPGDVYTEAQASADYLATKGVPGEAIQRETSSTNSWESLAAAARFLEADGVTDVILVSDPYHSYRIAAIARSVGLTPHVSPTQTSPIRGFDELRALGRETVAVSLGRIVGWQRLVRIEHKAKSHT
jgi:uncharacterized SAM-binding protein YcdF (DUF218 family)